jgi:PAS domain S-box-containing protein
VQRILLPGVLRVQMGYSGDKFGASSALGASQLPYVAALNNAAVGIYSVDHEGRCTQINPAALALMGYREDEVLGLDMHTLIHATREDGTPYPVETCPVYKARVEGKATHDSEEILWTKTGKPWHIACSAIPVAEADEPTGAVMTLSDLSARRDSEDRMRITEVEQREVLRQRDAAARIEQELATEQASRHRETTVTVERVAAEQLREQQKLSEDRLVQAEKLAAVGRLAASISHEINNPLEAVTNLLYLVRSDSSISPESNAYLEQAEQELGRVSQIVAQTLRFQRGGVKLTDCIPEKLIDSVIALHQGQLHHSGIRIVRQHRKSEPFRCADGDLRQILNNLLGNAIDAMKKTGGFVTIRTSPGKHPQTGGPGLRISVSDSGHGMSRSTAAQIFEPFYTTKGASGSGLGLWISNSIAKRHGGRLTVRSRTAEGARRGTTFSLFLPRIERDLDKIA